MPERKSEKHSTFERFLALMGDGSGETDSLMDFDKRVKAGDNFLSNLLMKSKKQLGQIMNLKKQEKW